MKNDNDLTARQLLRVIEHSLTRLWSWTWYGDGTFSVTPPFFKQLYTIHGEYLGTIFPMVFCLLPKKSSETYTAVFKIIKDKMESLGMSIEIQIFR